MLGADQVRDLCNEFQGTDPQQGHFQGTKELFQVETTASGRAAPGEESVKADECLWNRTGPEGPELRKPQAEHRS